MSSVQTIQEAKDAWHATIHADGGQCPVCERFGKVYTRVLNKTMMHGLQWLYDANMQKGLREWVNVPETAPKEVLRSNQLASLRWWGLVERQLPAPDDKKSKHSGKWRITLRGCDFVEGKLEVPLKVQTYNAEAIGFSDDLVTFSKVRGDFDYGSLVTAAAPSSLASKFFLPSTLE